MKSCHFAIFALAFSSSLSAIPVSSELRDTSAQKSSEHGPADPLTLARRVGTAHRNLYGNKPVAQSELQVQSHSEASSSANGCGSNCNSTLQFAGSAAKAFAVGNDIPSVGFKTKNSWAGNLPIGNSTSRELYFWLWGAEVPSDDLVLWLTGGPGCSSMAAFLQENGPIKYSPGTSAPIDASQTTSWTQLANMVWLDQPVGTGFTVGTPYAQNEDDIASGVSGFLDNFYETFPELQSKKLWIAGESYAGTYIPYVAHALYEAGNKHDLQGIFLIDPLIEDYGLSNYLVTTDFVAANNDKYLHLPQSAVDKINADADECGYGNGTNSYAAKNLKYPPLGPLPPYNEYGCNTFDDYASAAQEQNSAFSVYDISQMSEPNPPSVLGDPTDPNEASQHTWFDNQELQDYIHAPHQKWNLCNNGVFPNGDSSPPPDQTILGSVIEKAPSGRTIISNGDLDGLIMTNGTALALQNLTWGGERGFTKPPSSNQLIDTKGAWSGGFVTERGLTFANIFNATHQMPETAPYSGLKLLSYLLGKASSLGA